MQSGDCLWCRSILGLCGRIPSQSNLLSSRGVRGRLLPDSGSPCHLADELEGGRCGVQRKDWVPQRSLTVPWPNDQDSQNHIRCHIHTLWYHLRPLQPLQWDQNQHRVITQLQRFVVKLASQVCWTPLRSCSWAPPWDRSVGEPEGGTLGDSTSGCIHQCLPWPLTNHPPLASGDFVLYTIKHGSKCSPVFCNIWHSRQGSTTFNLYLIYFQVGTDTGYFPSASFAPSCHYVLDTSVPTNMTYDHSHF